MGLSLLGTASLLLSKEPIKQDALCSPNNIANLSIFYREKAGALGQFFTDLYFLVAVFLTVTLEDQGIKVAYIRPYSCSLGLVVVAIVGVLIR